MATVTWKQWRELFKFEKAMAIPSLSIFVMCPYLFMRVMWYATSKEFKAWPNTLDTGIVIGWRWPFQKSFKEWAWLKKMELPIAIYGTMDVAYLASSVSELRW